MSKELLSKKNRALLAELVRTDFKLRYQGSILGYAWSLLRPLFMFAILYVVFTMFLRLGDTIEHYPIYLLLGIVLWQFFSDITSQGLGSVVARGDLIRKIRIPRWMIVLASSVSALINLGLNLIIVAVFMIFNHVEVSMSILWLPLAVAEIYVFGVGLTLLLSAAFVKYRDISFIWEVIIQAGFYVTPLVYPISAVPSVIMQKLLLINPVAQAMQDARSAVVTKEAITIAEVFQSGAARLIPILICLLFFVVGVLYFKREAKHFAENL